MSQKLFQPQVHPDEISDVLFLDVGQLALECHPPAFVVAGQHGVFDRDVVPGKFRVVDFEAQFAGQALECDMAEISLAFVPFNTLTQFQGLAGTERRLEPGKARFFASLEATEKRLKSMVKVSRLEPQNQDEKCRIFRIFLADGFDGGGLVVVTTLCLPLALAEPLTLHLPLAITINPLLQRGVVNGIRLESDVVQRALLRLSRTATELETANH